jgi:hypothetical protein
LPSMKAIALAASPIQSCTLSLLQLLKTPNRGMRLPTLLLR